MKTVKWLMTMVCLLFVLGSISETKVRAETVLLGIGEYPPYHSKDLPGLGIYSRIVTAIFEAADVDVQFKFYPWKRALINAESGRVDGTALWEYNAEYEKRFHVSEAVVEISAHFFHLKTRSFDWETIDDLQGLRIGGLIGGYYGDEFQRAEELGEIEVDRVSTETQNLKKLLLGRIQALPISVESVQDILQKEGMIARSEELTYHPKPLYTVTVHLLLSKKVEKNSFIITKFNKALRELKRLGTIDRIMKDMD